MGRLENFDPIPSASRGGWNIFVREESIFMLLNMKDLLAVANEHRFAVPAFNISSYAMFNGIMEVCEEKRAPASCPTSGPTWWPPSGRRP